MQVQTTTILNALIKIKRYLNICIVIKIAFIQNKKHFNVIELYSVGIINGISISI